MFKMPAQIGRHEKSTLYEGVLNRLLDIGVCPAYT